MRHVEVTSIAGAQLSSRSLKRQLSSCQTDSEQVHIVAAFTFELSKVMGKPIRNRVLGQLADVNL